MWTQGVPVLAVNRVRSLFGIKEFFDRWMPGPST
jgi:hypothetical protein